MLDIFNVVNIFLDFFRTKNSQKILNVPTKNFEKLQGCHSEALYLITREILECDVEFCHKICIDEFS